MIYCDKQYTRCVQNITEIFVFEKHIYLFVYINVVAFEIVPIRYYAQACHACKTTALQGPLYF